MDTTLVKVDCTEYGVYIDNLYGQANKFDPRFHNLSLMWWLNQKWFVKAKGNIYDLYITLYENKKMRHVSVCMCHILLFASVNL